MKPNQVGYKFNEVEQGAIPHSLSEYISRDARFNLVKATVKGIEELLSYDKDVIIKKQLNIPFSTRTGASSILASELGITKQSVNRWLSQGIQSNNVNADKLLKTAMKYNPEETFIILDEDLENHRLLFDYLINTAKQGVTPTNRLLQVEQGAVPP